MKKKYIQITFALLAIFVFGTCKKKSENNPTVATCSDGIKNQGETGVDCGGPCTACNTNTGAALIKAKINGTQYSTSTYQHFLNSTIHMFSSQESGSNHTLGFSLSTVAKGKHDFYSNEISVVYTPDGGATPYTSNFGNTGSITITSNSGNAISGTFSCRLYHYMNASDSVVITNGEFTNLKYQ